MAGRKALDLSGERYGRLVAVHRTSNLGSNVAWCCLCDCGKYVIAPTRLLRSGEVRSCGCLRRETAQETVKKASAARNENTRAASRRNLKLANAARLKKYA